ncbi:MAG: hypothetical protein ACI8UD_003221 [Planctomycetota bacterium]|jgi:hypothetical protein
MLGEAMSRLPGKLFGSVLHAALLSIASAITSASVSAQDASEPQVTEFLARYCVRCHGPDRQKGDLRLDTLSRDFKDLHAAEQWRAVFYRVRFDEMPPRTTKKQPKGDARQAMLTWIDGGLQSQGRGIHLAEKMRLPQFGNYVDHEMLFSGEVTELAYTEARLWRQRPAIYAQMWARHYGQQHRYSVKIGGANRDGDLYQVHYGPHRGKPITARYFADERYANPFYEYVHHASGITDYADIAADQSSLEALLTNAEKMAEILTVGQSVAITTEVKTKDSRHGNNHGMFVGGEVSTSTELRGRIPRVFQALMDIDGHVSRPVFAAAFDLGCQLFLRRSPGVDEVDHYYRDLFLRNAPLGNTMALQAVLVAIAISPEFVYRMEMGLGEADEHGRRMLSPLELVFALQYSFTDTSPFGVDAFEADDVFVKQVEPLIKKALTKDHQVRYQGHGWLAQQMRNGKLQSRKHVEVAVRHMLASNPRNLTPNHNRDINTVSNPRILQFFREFFGYYKANDVFKEVDNFKQREGFQQFKNHTAIRLMYDTDALVLHVLREDRDVLYELLTTNKVFVSYWAGKHDQKQIKRAGGEARYRLGHDTQSYNLDPMAFEHQRGEPIEVSKEQRCGVLTQPSWLVAHSGNFDNDPVRRGKWIREKLLAGYVMDVPITVQAVIPDSETMTLRQRFEVVHDSACWQCHKKMNPLGMPFEAFNHVGRFRKLERDQPVDTSGGVDYTASNGAGDELDGDVADVRELMERLARAPLVRQSFIRHVFRYWMGRNEALRDSQTLRAMDQAYVSSGGSFRELLVSLLTSDSFLYRK